MLHLLLCCLPLVLAATEIRCYAGLKYVVGQDVYQDTENCDNFLGMGESYCYKFSEETAINEVVKMGCSKIVCNAFRNTCVSTEFAGMKGELCCCNDRHYCNTASSKKYTLLPIAIPIIIVFIVFVEIMMSDL